MQPLRGMRASRQKTRVTIWDSGGRSGGGGVVVFVAKVGHRAATMKKNVGSTERAEKRDGIFFPLLWPNRRKSAMAGRGGRVFWLCVFVCLRARPSVYLVGGPRDGSLFFCLARLVGLGHWSFSLSLFLGGGCATHWRTPIPRHRSGHIVGLSWEGRSVGEKPSIAGFFFFSGWLPLFGHGAGNPGADVPSLFFLATVSPCPVRKKKHLQKIRGSAWCWLFIKEIFAKRLGKSASQVRIETGRIDQKARRPCVAERGTKQKRLKEIYGLQKGGGGRSRNGADGDNANRVLFFVPLAWSLTSWLEDGRPSRRPGRAGKSTTTQPRDSRARRLRRPSPRGAAASTDPLSMDARPAPRARATAARCPTRKRPPTHR